MIDGAVTRYWFFSHFLFALTIFFPAEEKVTIPWIVFLTSFGLFLSYLSSTLFLSGIAALFGKRFLEFAWLALWSIGLLVVAGSCLVGAFESLSAV